MQGWISMIGASAALSACLVAGLAATDAVSAPAAWRDPPARPTATATATATAGAEPARADLVKTEPAKTVAPVKVEPACLPAAWPHRPAGCSAQGRAVRVISLTQR